MPERTHQLKFTVSDDELDQVRALAEDRGLSVADYLRQLIRREHEALATGRRKTKK